MISPFISKTVKFVKGRLSIPLFSIVLMRLYKSSTIASSEIIMFRKFGVIMAGDFSRRPRYSRLISISRLI